MTNKQIAPFIKFLKCERKTKKKKVKRKRTKKADPLITMNYVSLESWELLANIKAMVSLQELCKTFPIKSMECKKKKRKAAIKGNLCQYQSLFNAIGGWLHSVFRNIRSVVWKYIQKLAFIRESFKTYVDLFKEQITFGPLSQSHSCFCSLVKYLIL